MEDLWKEKLVEKTIQRMNYFRNKEEEDEYRPKSIEIISEKQDVFPFLSFSPFQLGFKVFLGISSIIMILYILKLLIKPSKRKVSLEYNPFPINYSGFNEIRQTTQSSFVDKSVKLINLKKFNIKDIQNPFIQTVELRNESLF